MNDGILLIDKEEGLTTRRIDNLVQQKFGTRKVGHLGTLDPFATGLVIVGVNKGTKFLPYIDDSTKSYIATLKLGIKTDSGDKDGNIIKEETPPSLTLTTIKEVLETFKGKSSQIPPQYSAIKINGEACYAKARRGEKVEIKPRAIEIISIQLIEYKDDTVVFTVTVSRGTYIRTLGEDIATKLGTVGHLINLRRLSVGTLLVANAKKLDDINETDFFDPLLLIHGMKHIEVDEEGVQKAMTGQSLDLKEDYGEKVLIVRHEVAIAVYKRFATSHYVPERGLF